MALDHGAEMFVSTLLLLAVLGEKLVSFAKWCWSSILGALFSFVVSTVLGVVFLSWAISPTSEHRLFSWLTIASVIVAAIFVWRLVLAINDPKYNCSVTETD